MAPVEYVSFEFLVLQSVVLLLLAVAAVEWRRFRSRDPRRRAGHLRPLH